MARWWRVLATASLLAGCAGTGLVLDEKPMRGEEMPVTFAYGDLSPDRAVYRAAVDRRRGTQVRRMVMHSDAEFAMFDVVTLLGDHVLVGTAIRPWVEGHFARAGDEEDEPIAWQATGRIGGVRRTAYETFAASRGRLQCVALERSLREHIETASDAFSQERVTGLYCRSGVPIGPEEVAGIADALRART